MTVIDKNNGTRLTVLDVAELRNGRPAYVVCKEGAPNQKMGRFKVAQDAVEPCFK